MAQVTTISTKELERQAQLAFEGQTLVVMLCQVGDTGYNAETTVANWETVEVDTTGYARYSEEIGIGSYDSELGAYVLPTIDAEFACLLDPYSYDRVVLFIDGEAYPHSVIEETVTISLAPGQRQTYRLSVRQDD